MSFITTDKNLITFVTSVNLNFKFRSSQKVSVNPKTDKDPTIFKVFKVFKILEEAMLDDKENLIERVRGIYCFKVTNSSGKEVMWIINAKTGKGSVTFYGTGNFYKLK